MTWMTHTTQMTGMTAWQEASQTIDRMVYFISSWFLITFTFSEFTAALSVMRFSFNSLIDWSFPLQIECDLEGNQTFSLPTNLLMYIPNGWTWKILLIYKCQATKRCSSRTDRRPWCREKMMKMPARRYWLVLVLYFVCCLMFRLPIQSSPWWLAQLTRAPPPRKCCSCWEQHSTIAAYLLLGTMGISYGKQGKYAQKIGKNGQNSDSKT